MGDNIEIKQMIKDLTQFHSGLVDAEVDYTARHTLLVDFYRYYMEGAIGRAEEEDVAVCCPDDMGVEEEPVKGLLGHSLDESVIPLRTVCCCKPRPCC